MAIRELTHEEKELMGAIVARFESQRELVSKFLETVHVMVTGSSELMALIHSVKRRVKTKEHLQDKLTRKILKLGTEFDVTPDNLHSKITDLAGYRILHLHTRQMGEINRVLSKLIEEAQYPLLEPPKAKVWDDESKTYFESIGIETEFNSNMYTGVHYLLGASTRTKVSCEIQVRTLAEEVWGEVDHSFNYPHPTESVACKEQIRVLARVTSSCSRLVDSIYKSYEDFKAK